MEERRRAPRYAAEAGQLAVLPFSVSVRVVDLSLGGALLEANQSVKIGTRGNLRLTVGGEPFSAEVEVRRVSPSGERGYQIGTSFVAISPECRQVIERFTQT